MKTLLAAAVMLLSASHAGAAGRPLLQDGFLNRLAETSALVEANFQEHREALRCLPQGGHTEDIPSYDPMSAGCFEDPFATPGQYQNAWAAFVRKILTGGDRPMEHEGEIQTALGRGNVRADALDEKNHWGDLTYVGQKDIDGQDMIVRTVAVTYRSHRVNLPGNKDLEAYTGTSVMRGLSL